MSVSRFNSVGEFRANLGGEVVRQVLAVRRRAMHVIKVQAERHGVVDRAFQFLRRRHAFKAELNRANGGGGDREQKFAMLEAARADKKRFRAPEVREGETPEGILL